MLDNTSFFQFQQNTFPVLIHQIFRCILTGQLIILINPDQLIYDIDVYDDGEELQITLHGNDFLHNMARMILGTLLDIGVGNRKKEDIELIFDSNSDVAASAPADPKGLYLQEVLYQ